MAEQIQNIPLGLLAATANPSALPLAGLLPAVPANRMPAAPAPQAGSQRPFAGLFNMGGPPSGYTPGDVQKIMQDRASYYQNFPIVPMWNGGKGAGGILPGIANFGAGFIGSSIQGRQEQAARENERIRREASERAGGARTLEEAVAALQGGTPEQSSAALQVRLQSLARAEQQRRQQELAQSLMDGIGGTPQPQSQAPAAAPQTAPPASNAPPLGSEYVDHTAGMPVGSVPFAGVAGKEGGPMEPPRLPGALGGLASRGLAWLNGSSAQPPAAPPEGVPPPGAQTAAPPAQPPAMSQPEPIVQIGNRRLPLSTARAIAMSMDAAGMRSEPLEKAIEDVAKKAGPDRSALQPDITAGLQHLAGLPERYGGDRGVFGSAVGSFQGDPESNWGINTLARGLGSLWTQLTQPSNSAPPAEVRRAIDGATNTLAQVLKPLIRGPGEGSWSDRDQMVLESIIGNLTRVNDVAGYRRELENIRQRIRANFNVDLPPLSFPGQGQAASGGGQAGANDPLGIR